MSGVEVCGVVSAGYRFCADIQLNSSCEALALCVVCQHPSRVAAVVRARGTTACTSMWRVCLLCSDRKPVVHVTRFETRWHNAQDGCVLLTMQKDLRQFSTQTNSKPKNAHWPNACAQV